MTTKDIVIAALWITGIVFFALVGFTITNGAPDLDLLALGLAAWLFGVLLDRFWKVA